MSNLGLGLCEMTTDTVDNLVAKHMNLFGATQRTGKAIERDDYPLLFTQQATQTSLLAEPEGLTPLIPSPPYDIHHHYLCS